MSWQAYVDTQMVATGNIDKGAIFSIAGDSVWASSPGFSVSADEIKAASKLFENPPDAFASGLYIAGEKYVTIKAEGRSIYGKKGREGAIIVKTTQALLVGHYPENVQPGNAALTVEKLADYLIGVGY